MNEEILKVIAKESVPIKSRIGLHIKEPHLLAFIAHEECKQTELLSKILEVLEKQNAPTINEVKTVVKPEETVISSKKETSK